MQLLELLRQVNTTKLTTPTNLFPDDDDNRDSYNTHRSHVDDDILHDEDIKDQGNIPVLSQTKPHVYRSLSESVSGNQNDALTSSSSLPTWLTLSRDNVKSKCVYVL